MTSEQRIAKLLARAGVASRREVERMIAEGRIALNGVAVDTPATLLTSLDGVTVDGQPVAAPEPTRLFLYHKPNGLLVAERDPKGRPTIYDRLPAGLPRLVPVGRLDLNTEGLLLLTTDGGFKRQLELPATGVERTYRARAYGEVSQAQLEELIHGIEIDGVRYGQIDANLERRTGANVWIEMTLREGKNREVRRVLEHLGLQVSRLIRLRYGPFVLDELPVGEVGEVRGADIVEFRKTLVGGIPADAIKPSKAVPGFRTPPTRAVGERPARTGAPRATAGTGERPRSPDRKPTGERRRRDEGRSSSPFGASERPARPRQDGKPYAKSPAGDRPARRDDDRATQAFGKTERSGRRRDDGKPFAKGPMGQRPGRSDARSDERGERPARGPQAPTGRAGRPSRPEGPRERPSGGGGGRPGGRPGGRR